MNTYDSFRSMPRLATSIGRLTPSFAKLGIGAAVFVLLLASGAISSRRQNTASNPSAQEPLAIPSETHLRNVRQLTFGGQNAEAYFSADDKYIIFQHQGRFYDLETHNPVRPSVPCDQIYILAFDAPPGKLAAP